MIILCPDFNIHQCAGSLAWLPWLAWFQCRWRRSSARDVDRTLSSRYPLLIIQSSQLSCEAAEHGYTEELAAWSSLSRTQHYVEIMVCMLPIITFPMACKSLVPFKTGCCGTIGRSFIRLIIRAVQLYCTLRRNTEIMVVCV